MIEIKKLTKTLLDPEHIEQYINDLPQTLSRQLYDVLFVSRYITSRPEVSKIEKVSDIYTYSKEVSPVVNIVSTFVKDSVVSIFLMYWYAYEFGKSVFLDTWEPKNTELSAGEKLMIVSSVCGNALLYYSVKGNAEMITLSRRGYSLFFYLALTLKIREDQNITPNEHKDSSE